MSKMLFSILSIIYRNFKQKTKKLKSQLENNLTDKSPQGAT